MKPKFSDQIDRYTGISLIPNKLGNSRGPFGIAFERSLEALVSEAQEIFYYTKHLKALLREEPGRPGGQVLSRKPQTVLFKTRSTFGYLILLLAI